MSDQQPFRRLPPMPPPHPAQTRPSGETPPSRPEVPLHPLLPGGAQGQSGQPLDSGLAAHQSPHAASSGPQDGARGAMWFALVTALVVLVCLVGAALLQLAS